jgi:hypothetical protein
MIGTSIVAAMETSLLAVQATRVMVMPSLAIVECGKAAWQDYFTGDDLPPCNHSAAKRVGMPVAAGLTYQISFVGTRSICAMSLW